METYFIDREQAGVLLGAQLKKLSLTNPLVLALPRGGVPVAYEIAKKLNAPLDVLIVRKVGAPQHEELGIGAITEDGHYWIDPELSQLVGASDEQIEGTLNRERQEVARRIMRYRQDRPLPDLRHRSVVLVDDGLATGVTARVACSYLKSQGAQQVILATPVCSPTSAAKIRADVAQLICLVEPEQFLSVGQFYQNFEQVSDAEVIALLRHAKAETQLPDNSRDLAISIDGVTLGGTLSIPDAARGIVLFAHGSGSSRFSPRNQQVAHALNNSGIATLLFDLLTPEESDHRGNVFDIPLLGRRLTDATHWLDRQGLTAHLPRGYFGASTGAAAALWAAAELGQSITAVVCRGGRPDLAGDHLSKVQAPVLLLVGQHDQPVLALNRSALVKLSNSKLIVIPNATHLFEEPGTMELVEQEACRWFLLQFAKENQREVA